MYLPAALLLLLPLAEIAGFVLMGQWIGVLPTLGLVIASGVIGVLVLKQQGVTLVNRLRQRQATSPEAMARDAMEGTAQMFGGLLLVIPGFLTDILGIMLLIPMVRTRLWDFLRPQIVTVRNSRRTRTEARSGSQHGASANMVIDLDHSDFERQPGKPDTPWNNRPPES
ncbi:FxsA family protein [Allorhizobium undicola]|uniref:FxsA family protein n=1 Tax=Allorhizobium undicola TaxID=78527 RepID=UPI00068861DD|nr:FxsA family protein [Allorhizobium undicola]